MICVIKKYQMNFLHQSIFSKYHSTVDKIAFIRFASVYREFKDLGEFKTQIDDLSN